MDTIDKVNIRLKKILEYTNKLKKYRGVTAQELIKDMEKSAIIERFLQLSAEAVIDIANLLNAEYRFRPATDARESIIILGEEGILSKKFAEQFAPIANFRNILVHDYIKIDYKKVADKMNNRLGDFEIFAKAVAKYLR